MNLASAQFISNLQPIEGADLIEKATVLGWEVVVKKDEYTVGDLCCYIQIDTVVPEKEEFEFLRDRKFRVRTIKLRKQISQGLIIPLPRKGCKQGDDLTDTVGVKKYEKPDNNPTQRYVIERIPKVWYKKYVYLFKYRILYKIFPTLQKVISSTFPKHLVSITDEERIQNSPKILQSYKGKEFVVSYKLDGSSITIIHEKKGDKSKFRICSRKFELHDEDNDWYKVFKSTNFSKYILQLVDIFNTYDIIVQGEAIGKFNGNHHNLSEPEIRLFNIIVKGKRIDQERFLKVCYSLSIPHCPKFDIITLNHTMEEILKISEIKDVLNPKVEAEGLVWRCIEDNTSFKVINNKYLLKNEE